VLKNALLYKTWDDAAVRRIVAIHNANSLRRWRDVVRWGVCQFNTWQTKLTAFFTADVIAAAAAIADIVDGLFLLYMIPQAIDDTVYNCQF
jgi:hypothetical protein